MASKSTSGDMDGGNKTEDSQLDLTAATDSFTSTIAAAYTSVVGAVSWLLYGLHRDTSITFLQALILIVLETWQWNSFAFFDNFDAPWNNRLGGWLITATYYSSNFMGLSTKGLLAAYTWVLCIPLIAAMAYFGQKHLGWSWPMGLFRIWVVSSASFMFLPVTGALLRMVFGCLQDDRVVHYYFSELTCGSVLTTIGVVAGVIWLTFFVVVVCIVVSCFFELNPNQRIDHGDRISATARSSAQGELYNVVFRFILQLCFIIFTQFEYHRWPLGFLIVLLGLYLVVYQYLRLPYYSEHMQSVIFAQALLIAWSGVGVFVTNIRGDDRVGALFLIYLCSPIIVITAFLIVRSRVDDVLFWGTDKLTTPYLVELKARVAMLEGVRRYQLDEPWMIFTPEQARAHEELRKRIEDIFKLGIQRFPRDARLHVHFAAFYLYHANNKPLGYRELSAAERCELSFDVRFAIFLYRNRSEKESKWVYSSDVQVRL